MPALFVRGGPIGTLAWRPRTLFGAGARAATTAEERRDVTLRGVTVTLRVWAWANIVTEFIAFNETLNDATDEATRRLEKWFEAARSQRAASHSDHHTGSEASATPLVDALRVAASDGTIPLHVPGHARGKAASAALLEVIGRDALRHDLTELSGLDMLSTATGCIREAQELAAAAFGAEASWLLVNGTTVGIHASMMATCRPGDVVVLSRNCHQSALAACVICGTTPVFAEVEVDPDHRVATRATPAAVAAALDAAEALASKLGGGAKVGLLLVVSPSYFGTCCDLAGIAVEARARGVPLAVDEAHGAHFGFHARLPPSALSQGADVAVQSTHKVLPALTQASMLHLARGSQVPRQLVSSALQVLQTSSPSYLLMASLDAARAQVSAPDSTLLSQAVEVADLLRSRIGSISGIALLDDSGRSPEDAAAGSSGRDEGRGGASGAAGSSGRVLMDPTRLTVGVWGLGMTGYEAADNLRRLGVSVELSTPRSVVLVATGGLSLEDADRAAGCFEALAAEARLRRPSSAVALSTPSTSQPEAPGTQSWGLPQLELRMSPREAFFADREAVPPERAAGRVSAETLSPYPPGIPVAVPGAILSERAVAILRETLQAGGTIAGASDPALATLQVLTVQ